MAYDQKIYTWLMNKQNLSSYNKNTMDIMLQLPISPLGGYFDVKPSGSEYNCVDMC